MNVTDLTAFWQAFFPFGFIKLSVLLLLGMYSVVAAIIVRQEQLMARVVEIPFSPLLRVIALVHLIAAIGVFFLSLIFL
jgi:hypothetical protein